MRRDGDDVALVERDEYIAIAIPEHQQSIHIWLHSPLIRHDIAVPTLELQIERVLLIAEIDEHEHAGAGQHRYLCSMSFNGIASERTQLCPSVLLVSVRFIRP